jgi:hypothetical protein
MSSIGNARIQSKRDTIQAWNAARGFVPLAGEVIIYTDYKIVQREINGVVKNVFVPGIKIGDGQTYVQDLPFVDDELRDMLMEHINNQDIHVTLQQKLFWDNKLNVVDTAELIDGTLIFNRD